MAKRPTGVQTVAKTRRPPTQRTTKVYVRYEVIDPNGQVAEGFKVRNLGVEKDVKRIVDMTLSGQLDGQYLPVEIVYKMATGETGQEDLAQAAE
jgi:negative regulator of sigma E activity